MLRASLLLTSWRDSLAVCCPVPKCAEPCVVGAALGYPDASQRSWLPLADCTHLQAGSHSGAEPAHARWDYRRRLAHVA